eukprot:scaffold10864_cov131-Skeletonema_menzelii.AAC.1
MTLLRLTQSSHDTAAAAIIITFSGGAAGYHQKNVIIFNWTLDSREPPNQGAALPQAIMNFNAFDQKRKYR